MGNKRRWQDGFGPVVGLSAWDSYLFGVMVLVLSGLALTRPWLHEERIGMIIGLWLIADPFVLGFSSHHAATLSHIAIGLLFVADVLMVPETGGRARI
jgi:hypothetical protein